MNRPAYLNILITGSSRGIGSAIAKRLASPATRIVINYLEHEKEAQETADFCSKKGARVLVIQADVSKPQDVQSMFEKIEQDLGPIDVLVNNAGISVYGMIQDITYEDWKRVFAVNIDGMFLCTQQAVDHMVSQKWGRIINLSSMWGIVGASCESLYASTKGAINAFTKSCAKELAYSGINVNCIAPGVVDTDMIDQLSHAMKEDLKEEIPAGRFQSPDEVALWVEHLILESGDYITGQIISPNGGLIYY